MDIPCLMIGRLNTDKMSVLPNFIYRFHIIPVTICRYLQTNSKTYIENQKTWNIQHNTEEDQIGGLTLPDVNIHNKAKVIKMVQYW